MAEFSFTLPDEDVPRLVAGLCSPKGLALTIENTRLVAIEIVKTQVQAFEQAQAAAAATAAVPTIEIV